VPRATHVSNWSPVSPGRYEQARESERAFWTRKASVLTLRAQYYFYAGYYRWTTRKALLNPFGVNPSRPANFAITAREIRGKSVVDVGCGRASPSLSLVQGPRVHAVDPLLDF
jgi:hypothetical protein